MSINKTTATERLIALESYADKLEKLLQETLRHLPAGNGARLAEDYEEHPLRTDIREALASRPK